MLDLRQRWRRRALTLGAGALALVVVASSAQAANPSAAALADATPSLANATMDPAKFVEDAGDDDDPFGLAEAIADGLKLELVSRTATGEAAIEFVEVRGHFTSDEGKALPLWRPIAKFLIDHRPGGGSWLVSDLLVVRPLTVHGTVLDPTRAIEAVEGTSLPGRLGTHGVSLVVVTYPDESRIAWRVDPSVDREALYNSVFLVDDRSGSTRLLTNRLYLSALRAYPRSPVATPAVDTYELASLDGAGPFLETAGIVARNCLDPGEDGACTAAPLASADAEGDFLYEPAADDQVGDPFAETSAYYHVDRVGGWLAARGFAGHACQREGLPLTVTTNFAYYDDHQPIPTALSFYAGTCDDTISLGQGARDAAYDGDIVAHELGHGVLETLAGESYGVESFTPYSAGYDSRAIAEGFADFLAAAVSDDSQVGAYFLAEDARDLDHDFTCPRDLTGEIHADGELIAGALWAAREELGEGFFVVALDALMILGDDASFEDYAAALIAVARVRLGAAAEATLAAILDERGLLDCERVVALDELGAGGEHPGLGAGVLYLLPPQEWYEPLVPLAPPPVQLAITFPPDTDLATIDFAVAGAGQRVVALVHSDSPVEFTYEPDVGSRGVVSPDTLAMSGAESGELVLEGSPGQTLYLALVHGGPQHSEGFQQPVRLYDFTAEFRSGEEDDPPDDDDTEGGDSEGSDLKEIGEAGCACASGGADRSPPIFAWLAGLAALAGVRRRRRRAKRERA